MPRPTTNDVVAVRDMIGWSDEVYADWKARVEALRAGERKRLEAVQKSAAASAARQVTPPDGLRKQKQWVEWHIGW